MTKWTTEVRLYHMHGELLEVVTLDSDETNQLIVELARMDARFVYKGFRYWAPKPTVERTPT